MSFTNVSLSISLTEQIDRKKMDIILKNFNRLYDEKKLGRFVDTSKGYTEVQDRNTVLSILKNFDKNTYLQTDIIQNVYKHHSKEFKDLLELFKIVLLIHSNTCCCERGIIATIWISLNILLGLKTETTDYLPR